jgi:hypothetical protein
MGKWRVSLIVIALGLLTLFPPWVLTRTLFIYGDGFWTVKERTESSETYTEMEASQEIGRLGHHPLWAFSKATANPNLSVQEGLLGQRLFREPLRIPGPLSVKVDFRLLLTEYGLVLIAGLLWSSWRGRGAIHLAKKSQGGSDGAQSGK